MNDCHIILDRSLVPVAVSTWANTLTGYAGNCPCIHTIHTQELRIALMRDVIS